MILDALPIFRDLAPANREALLALAHTRTFSPGEVLFYQGDPAPEIYLLTTGRCTLHRDGDTHGDKFPPALLDPVATLGSLPHGFKATARDDVECLCWPVDDLWQSASFAAAARRYLAAELCHTQDRLADLEAPIHYVDAGAALVSGPFMFDNTTMILAFCDADLDSVRAILPEGLHLLKRPGRARDSIFLAFAVFPNAYPEHDPAARFAYTETTCFVPVRYRRRIGLFVPYIYPSTWEPILLGREIYGFPKRLGRTVFDSRQASLVVDEIEHMALTWDGLDASSETRLVRALVDWLGIEGRAAALAFRAGEALRKTMRLPPYRRVGVYNHKRILSPAATYDAPAYNVNCLTHAIFGVLRWYQIARMRDPVLTVTGGPLAGATLTLREAYRTQLALRLSTGRVVRDYTTGENG